MAKLERTYIVPLRKRTQLAPCYKRAKKCVNVLREFIQKHMKCKDVRIGNYLNQHIWKDGIQNFPHHVEVTAVKDTKKVDGKDVEFVFVELLNLPKKALKNQEKAKVEAVKAEKKKKKPKADAEPTEEVKEDEASEDKPKKKVVKKVVKKTEE
jgi:ribosomal protein L31E